MALIRLKRIIPAILTLMLLAGATSIASAAGWEPVKTERTHGQRVGADSEIEIRTAGGTIFVTASRHIKIEIFTILGSRIAEDNLAPGSYQFTVPTHGVFIIKAGDLTCKVAV